MSNSFLLTTNSPSCFALSKCSSWMPKGLSLPAWHSPKLVWITLSLQPVYLHYDSKGNLCPLTIVCLSSMLQGTTIWPWSCSVYQACLGVELFTGTILVLILWQLRSLILNQGSDFQQWFFFIKLHLQDSVDTKVCIHFPPSSSKQTILFNISPWTSILT